MALTLGLMALVSCNKEKQTLKEAVFTANIEQHIGQQNRTAINPENGDVKWLAGDKILIANGNGETAQFTLQSGAGSTEGTFRTTGEFEMEVPFTAVYPQTANLNGTMATFTLPATQTLTQPGTFANGANPMAAYASDDNLYFRNLCGALDIRLLGDNVHVSGIRITGAEGEMLNGTFAVDCSANEPAIMANQGTNGTNIVTLNCDVTLTSTTTPQEFFVVLPVGALAQGFTMEVLDGENVVCTKTLETNLAQIVRNEVKRFNPLLIGEMPEPPVGPQGIIDGAFTINANGGQVYFSQGNLQYQASTNTWQFAEHQWDYVGNANSAISQTNSGWIDLFCWGTSGYNHGANCYQPWSTSNNYSDYYAYGNWEYNLYDQTGQADWGYNAISNGGNTENSGWRTLTNSEWDYVFNTRSTASGIRWAQGTVNGVGGTILLPDNWASSIYALNDPNGGNYDSNTITAEDWANTLEANGAVFLPAAGGRYMASVLSVGSYGYYWSTSYYYNYWARLVYFYSGSLSTNDYNYRNDGFSVRLVRSCQ